MSLRLPARPNLDLLKRQAKAALRVGRLLNPSWRLADAQRALAKGYGIASWTTLKREVMAQRRPPASVDADAAAEGRPSLDTAARARVPGGFVGSWISRAGQRDRAALEIAEMSGALQLTQVVTEGDAHGTASCLLLWADGRDHHLPVGEGLRLRATLSDEHTLEMAVTRDDATVAKGTYALSDEGHTLNVTAGPRRLVFDRAVLIAMLMISWGCAATTRHVGVTPRRRQPDSDVKAIEALNRHDVTAALASDGDAILSQWTEDFVLLPPAGPIVRGRAANAAMITNARPQIEKFEPIAYEVNFEEIVVAGDYAFAWGQFRSAARPRAGGSDIVSNGKLLRIYQRQPDGRWLMHRTMVTMDQPRP